MKRPFPGMNPYLERPWDEVQTEVTEPEARQRFHAEAEAAANLRHVHIVTIFDYGELEEVMVPVLDWHRFFRLRKP